MANQTRQLARLLGQEGAEVEIVQVNAPYRPRWVGSLRGVRALFRLVPFLVRLWSAAGRVQLFHVMANSGWAWHLCAAPAIWIAKLRHVPVVVNYRGGLAEEFFAQSFFWIRPTMRLADRLVVPSGFLQQVFTRCGLIAEIVPNVVDLRRFVPRTANSSSRPDKPHLIVTRNLESIYDVGTALHSLAIVRKTWPGAHMTVAGGGPEREKLAELTRTLGLEGSVTFTGRLDNDQMVMVYQQADLFLNPSVVDNMPISILEALASGVPVVSTDVGGIPFMVEHQKTAVLVPPRDAHAMALALLDLLNDPGKAERLANAGRESAQQYAWQHVRKRLFEVYFGLVPGAPENAAAETK
jgi:glycosyltransferase involved in cell wall biosynthesis